MGVLERKLDNKKRKGREPQKKKHRSKNSRDDGQKQKSISENPTYENTIAGSWLVSPTSTQCLRLLP